MNELSRQYLEEKYENLLAVKVLDLSSQNLRTINAEAFRSLRELSKIELDKNKIQVIHSNAFFVGLSNQLKFLCLSENQIEDIDPRAFEGLVNLKKLELQKNKLKLIHTNTFSSLTNLESLDLNRNQIGWIEPRLFENLTNLKELQLYGNKLKRFHRDTFESLVKLESLNMSVNKIEEMEPALFRGLSNLKELVLVGNNLKILDRACFRYLSSIGKVILTNSFEENILSYFNRLVFEAFNPDYIFYLDYQPVSISTFERYLKRYHSYTSDFKIFLNQFPKISSEFFFVCVCPVFNSGLYFIIQFFFLFYS